MNALADEAATAWGGTVVRLIRARENAVFEMVLPKGRAALRLHRQGYQSAEAIRSELWWCEALAKAGVAVPRALRANDGDLLVHLSDGRIASAIDWVDGTALGAAGVPLVGDAAAQVRVHHRLGQLVAEVHVATDRLQLPPGFTRPRWDADGLVGDHPHWGRFWDHPALNPDEADLLCHARDLLRLQLAAHAEGGDQGLIHADVLRENVILDDGALHLIDFDDSGFGFRLYDLGTALSQNLAEPERAAITAALIEGYASIRPLSRSDRAMVPWFTLARCLASVGWTIPRLAPDHPIVRPYISRALGCAREVIG